MKTTYALIRTVFFCLAFFACAAPLAARQNQIFDLTADSLKAGEVVRLNVAGWKYRSGDDLSWASPQLDDSAWETLEDSTLKIDDPAPGGWNGIGWFRLRVRIDQALANKQLTLTLYHWGASEIHVDGELIGKYGVVSPDPAAERAFNPNGMPLFFSFNRAGEHVIAVRHSVAALPEVSSFWSRRLMKTNPLYGVGLFSTVGWAESAAPEREYFLKLETANRFGRAGLLLTVGLLFLLMYSFFPSLRANLYFALFALATVGNNLCNYLIATGHYDVGARTAIDVLFWFFWALVNVSLLAFLYTAFSERIPRHFPVFVALWAVYLAAQFLTAASPAVQILQSLILFLTVAEEVRIMTAALGKKISGAWIVGIGLILFVALQLLNALAGLSVAAPELIWLIVRISSALGITLAIAVYLARSFARLPRIEAENERRAKELEEARQLQLSMLPKKLPQISNLEIAAYMKPATEVGGDYYDFYVGEDGTLTVAVGDATGHGLKAGSVVTATKSLFNALAAEPHIPTILSRSNLALKAMNLRGLFMAVAMLKMKDDRLSVSIAGMPPILIYRAATGRVEEIAIRATPLGSIAKTVYQNHDFTLAPGDTILLMSDGFPEMFNGREEMLEYERAKKAFAETAANSPQEIIDRFVELGEQWADGRPADDDVTFVVLKVGNENLN